ncbi:MAG TPA: hypothetical protein VLJ60_12050, partial [bacterium]|nr:hypothetical protein [bacterium]
YEMQEYGTMIMKLGACYFYTKIQEGYKFGPDMGAIDIAKLYDNAIEETKKLFPGAIPIASIHNHPTGGNWTTLEDNERTAERGILNITLLKGPDQYSLKTTRGVRKNKEPYRKEVLDSYVFLLRYNVTN